MTMTDTEAEALALALVNEIRSERGRHPVKTIIGFNDSDWDMAFRRVIEREAAAETRHAAELRELKERFSEVAVRVKSMLVKGDLSEAFDAIAPFILHSPDPLAELAQEAFSAMLRANSPDGLTEALRAAIEARGGKIVWEAGE